jgi:hypothetical protein
VVVIGRVKSIVLAENAICYADSNMHSVRAGFYVGVYVAIIAVVACQRAAPQNDKRVVGRQSTAPTQSTLSTTTPAPSSETPSESQSHIESTMSVAEIAKDWRAAKWGMTEAEVRAACPSVVPIQPPDDYDRAQAFGTLALPDVKAADLEFTAKFLFSKMTHTLVMVLLSRQPERPSEYTQVFTALTGKYGSPLQSKDLNVASLDNSSPEQERKTRIGSASASWAAPDLIIGLEYFDAMGMSTLIVSYKPRPDDRNL